MTIIRFLPQQIYTVGNGPYLHGGGPYSLSIADVNGDGIPDLIAGNFGDNTLSVLLGNGDGTFQPQMTFAGGTGAYGLTSMVIGDVNGDGRPDVITANWVNSNVTVMLGNGNGTFQAPIAFATGSEPNSVALADLNGDGKLDIVTANTAAGSVSILLGNGDGTFQPQKSIAVGSGPVGVTLGDVNGDGKVDIVTSNYSAGTVSVLLGNGDGTFQAPQSYAVAQNDRYVVLGDLNGDGKLDIVTSSGDGTNVLSILLGNGDGTFQPAETIAAPGDPYSLSLADMNGDGKLDIVVADRDTNAISIFLGNGDGTFQSAQSFAVGTDPVPVAIRDLNGDGIPDIVAGDYSGDTLSVLLSDAVPPVVATVTESPSGGDLNAGKTVMITLTTSKAVTVTGTPTATLNDGGTATYSSISADGKTLTFTYTVGSTDSNVTSLQVTSINLLNGATIKDGGGNNLSLSLSAVPSYSGPQIDTSTPTLSSVTANPSTGTVFANQVVTITVSFSENVAVTGTPALSLNDNGTATYQSGSGTNALVFSYSVPVGQYTSNLAVTALNLPNGATIKDGGGNNANLNGATVSFSGLQISGSVVDSWISSSSGNWTTAADWSSGVPNSNSDAVISKAGNYTVTLSNVDTAHSLSLNDTGAIVSDNTGASLKLAGGSGALAITNGIFQLAGGSLQAGTISISAGGTFLIAKGTYSGSNALSETITDNGSLTDNTTATITGNISGTGTVLAENKANLTIAGSLTGSEHFTLTNTAHVFISTAVNSTDTGSFTITNSAVLEFGAGDTAPITFASGSSGTVKFDQSLTQPTGTISGLTPKTKIDLADLPFTKGAMTIDPSFTATGGTLTVTNQSTNQSVSLNLSGNFTNAKWTLSSDGTGGTLVVDPPAPTSTNNGSPGLDHVVALLNQSIAAGFSDHQNGVLNTNPLSQTLMNQEQFLANPHHG